MSVDLALVAAFDLADPRGGPSVSMVSAVPEVISIRDGETWIGEAKVIGSVRASNGWVHVIDAVLVPAEE